MSRGNFSLIRDLDLDEISYTAKLGEIRAPLYVTAGECCKIIGTQNGLFPDFGHHLPNEMGGVWLHPIKILDGYFCFIDDELLRAQKFESLPYGSIFSSTLANGLNIERMQFSPDALKGFILKYKLHNSSKKNIKSKLRFNFRFNILPVWASEELGIFDAPDIAHFSHEVNAIVARDTGHEWHVVLTSSEELNSQNVTLRAEQDAVIASVGEGYTAEILFDLELAASVTKEIEFYIAGSWHDQDEAISHCFKLKKNSQALLVEKKSRYDKIKKQSHVNTGDDKFDLVAEWIKYNTDWLKQNSDELGNGLMAGLPEYAWWFGCDTSYSIQGLLAIGEFELAKNTLELLWRYSKEVNGNGRIVHEVTTFGHVYNKGNTQETAHYITAVYKYLMWTGDSEFAGKLYSYCVQGIDWLLGVMDKDGDLLPSGYGIIEIEGLNVELIDSAVYTCEALFSLHEMSIILGHAPRDYLEKAERLKKTINEKLFDTEENLFVDAVGTPRQILERIPKTRAQINKDVSAEEQIKKQSYTEAYKKFLDRQEKKLQALDPDIEVPFILNRNWVMCTAMETGLATQERARLALATMNCPDFIGEHGAYLSGYERTHMMTISTGALALAFARYGQVDTALDLLEKIVNTFGAVMPGSINEMSPDYGCFTQAWTVYAFYVPVLECFVGLRIDALKKELHFNPCIPTKWDKLDYTGLRLADNTQCDFYFTRQGEQNLYTVHASKDWRVIVPSNDTWKIVQD